MNTIERAIPIALVAILPITIAGCVGTTDHRQQATTDSQRSASSPHSDRETTMLITLLGFDGCPLTPLMKERLEQATEKLDRDLNLLEIDQQSLSSSDLRRGYPAPTVLVNESDLYGMAEPTSPSMGCRMYEGPGGVPTVSDLLNRLQEALANMADGERGEG